jgi:phosphoglycolate phosphatase-like HAD superfamily hydrolase
MFFRSETQTVKNLRGYLGEKSKRCLIFDFDETIFTLELPWEVYFAELRERLYELDPSLAEVDGMAKCENEAVRRLGEQAIALKNEYSAFFEREYLAVVTEHTDLTDFIRNERENYTFFLWSSNMRSTIEPELARTKLLPLFAKLVCKDSVSLIKPDPEGFSLIFDELNFRREEYLMIGNSHHDQAAAEAAGIDFFLVKH